MRKFDLIRYVFFGFSGLGVLTFALEYWLKHRISILSMLAAGVILTGWVILLDMYIIEPNWIAVEKVTIQDSGALATKMKGLKVLHISDIHTQNPPGFREKRLVTLVNKLQPDLLLITGDFLDDMDRLRETINLIKSLKAKIGIYGVLGNTDHHRFRTKGLIQELNQSGITILLNENRRVTLPNGQYIWIAGIDDPVTGRARLEQSLTGIPAGEPVMLLAHSPDIYTQAILAKVNMVFVGHTHGGQVGIPFLIQRSDYANRSPFMAGQFHDGSTTMYVNRGIGTKTLPIRFLCRPEITDYTWH